MQYLEMNPAAPSRTRITPADIELARAYLTRHGADDLLAMVLGESA